MRPTQKLGELIATHMAVPGHVSRLNEDADFVMSGLRAACHVNPGTRSKILEEVSSVLGCNAQDLDFLFAEFEMPVAGPASYEVMVPDFQTQLLAAQ